MSDLQTTFELLHSIVGNGHRAQRHAPMTDGPNHYSDGRKYSTVHEELSDDQIAAHLTGSATYAVPLVGRDELASAGLIEQDAGGIDMAGRILAAAEARNVTMFAIVVKGSNGHDGCHPWALYGGRYDPKAIQAQLKQIALDAGAATGEIHPNKTNIRLPFGKHRWNGTRGRLLLQSGEVFDLDTELDAAECAVLALPLNGQPPAIPDVIRNQGSNTTLTLVANVTPARTTTGAIDVRAIAAAVRTRFNDETQWPSLLEQYNGVERREGWACNCGFAHTHNVQLAVTSQDKLVSFSPNCRWAPHRTSGKAIDKFGFYVDQEHGGRYMAAVEAKAREYGLWVEPKATLPNDKVEPVRYTDEQRAAWRDAKRAAHAADATAIRETVSTFAATDTRLTPCDRVTLREMLAWAAEHNSGSCWLGRASLARLTGYSLGSVKRSVMHLEALGYFESEGSGGRPIDTARRNFSRGSFFVSQTISEPKNDPRIVYIASDHTESVVASEVAPALPPDDLDTWQWADDGHGADELSDLEMFPESGNFQPLEICESAQNVEPEAEISQRIDTIPTLRHCHGRYQVADGARFGGWSATAAGAWEAWELSQIGTVEPGKSNMVPEHIELDQAEPAGASYTPVELPERAYTGQARQYMTDADRRALALESMRLREQPAGTVNVLTLGDADSDDPLIRVAPSDPKAAREYWQLKNKKAKSAKQAIWMRRRVAELEALMPLSEWKEQPAPGGVWLLLDGARPIRARSQAPNRAHIQEVFV